MKTNQCFADLLPPLSTEEMSALKADIKQNGVRDPILVDEEGNILDGKNRFSIDPSAPRRVIKGLTDGEKEAFVFRCNFTRRNLSPSQKTEVRKRMKLTAEKLRAEDKRKWTQAAVAIALGVARQTVTDWFEKTMPNAGSGKAHNQTPKNDPPDARVKVPAKEKPRVAERVKAGESQSQVAADYGVNQSAVSRIVHAEEKKDKAESDRKHRIKELDGLNIDGFFLGDFREVAKKIPDGSVDLIFTDPPYDRETLPLYGEMAEIAANKLVDGGSLICYLGQYQMDKVLQLMTNHLRLWWTLAVIHLGDDLARMREYGVIVKWKPLLWFVKGTRGDKQTFVMDAVDSPAKEKDHHPWQQAIIEASYYIEKLTKKGGLVFDPFCGGGTTAKASADLGRKFITCDIDAGSLTLAKGRMNS